jgi:N-carbamoylputrescine amidase
MTQPRTLSVAALQLPLASWDEGENIAAVTALVEQAAKEGAQVILPPELFSSPYFCTVEDEALFALAKPTEHPSVIAMQKLAKGLGVAIPTSYFERDGHHYYNTLAMIDADGQIMGTYRKSHIPDGPGYEEKYYFRPGNTGFKVWDVFGARIGVGICWDQWYPECARAMACWAPRCCSIPPPSGPSPMTRSGHQPHVAPGDDWPCRVELYAGGGVEPHRRGGRGYDPDLLWPQLHQRRMGRSAGRLRA